MTDRDGNNYQRGESHHKAKLCKQDVINIRAIHAEYKEGLDALKHMTPTAQALKHGVSKNAIESVIYFKSWKDVI